MKVYSKQDLVDLEPESGWYYCKWTDTQIVPTIVRVSKYRTLGVFYNYNLEIIHEGRSINWFLYFHISLMGPIELINFSK